MGGTVRARGRCSGALSSPSPVQRRGSDRAHVWLGLARVKIEQASPCPQALQPVGTGRTECFSRWRMSGWVAVLRGNSWALALPPALQWCRRRRRRCRCHCRLQGRVERRLEIRAARAAHKLRQAHERRPPAWPAGSRLARPVRCERRAASQLSIFTSFS